MFTGLIEEVGTVLIAEKRSGGLILTVKASEVIKNAATGDSISINGACQTVTSFNTSSFCVTAVEETLKRTTLGELRSGDKVNLETSLTLNKKLGGHLVQGHVDCTGKISEIRDQGTGIIVKIEFPDTYSKYLIHVGSVTIEGISLTVADFTSGSFKVSIIPHTWENTNLKYKKTGSRVNLEFDVLGKYVESILKQKGQGGITKEWLNEMGF